MLACTLNIKSSYTPVNINLEDWHSGLLSEDCYTKCNSSNYHGLWGVAHETKDASVQDLGTRPGYRATCSNFHKRGVDSPGVIIQTMIHLAESLDLSYSFYLGLGYSRTKPTPGQCEMQDPSLLVSNSNSLVPRLFEGGEKAASIALVCANYRAPRKPGVPKATVRFLRRKIWTQFFIIFNISGHNA